MKNFLVWAGAILYGVSPLDVIPDIVPPFTWIDDVCVLIAARRYTSKNQD